MCMMCEEEAMYQAYLEYLARKAAQETGTATEPQPQAAGFVCDPIAEPAAAEEPVAPAESKVG